ncbi:GT4_PimA-like domain containing protein [Candidatus Nanopelagicaceae bacterium]
MKTAFIFVDNLRIGGFQRLALDQAYFLRDEGFVVTLVSLEELPDANLSTFLSQERELLSRGNIRILSSGYAWKPLFETLTELTLDLNKSDLILTHSLRAAASLKLIRLFKRNKFNFSLIVHQIPKLTDPIQRKKRLIYSQFCDHLFCFSKAVELGWTSQMPKVPKVFIKVFTRSIETLRNGVYLPRLPAIASDIIGNRRTRIYFLGRPTFWKGLETIETLAASNSLIDYDFVFLVPEDDDELFKPLRQLLGERLVIISGKTIASLNVQMGDVHLYPANYGPGVDLFESISLNCLEFACLGIPSIVTRGGLYTWSDLLNLNIFFEEEWSDISSVTTKILEIGQERAQNIYLSEIRSKVDIANQMRELLKK